jgi:hypothetical protein
MKKLVLLLVVFTSFSLFAQVQVDDRKTSMNDQTNDWMVKISSDSEMRIQMMDMMVEKTKGNTEEMNKIVNSISKNPELQKMIAEAYPERAGGENMSIEPLGITNDNTKVGKMVGTQPVPTAPIK